MSLAYVDSADDSILPALIVSSGAANAYEKSLIQDASSERNASCEKRKLQRNARYHVISTEVEKSL